MEPSSRDEFEIAIICALTREADAVEALFDDIYNKFSRRYSKQTGDVNTYINGRLGSHDVVLCYLPENGKRSAAAAANLRVSYPNIKLALVVGICGGIPFVPPNKTEVIMGDVILSNSVVKYNFGKQYPDEFRRRSDPREILGRASAEIKAFSLALAAGAAQDDTVWKYPGNNNDVLVPASLRHQHSSSDSKGSCVCFGCNSNDDRVCDEAIEGDCESVGCSGSKIQRARLAAKDPDPSIHIGSIACADTIIDLEMESAGVWDNLPCIIIKGVCDYADSHKNKYWQEYAAGTAACCTKAFLEDWWSSSQRPREPSQGGWPPYLEQPAIVQKSSTLSTIAGQLREYYDVPQRLRVTRISGESHPMSQCYINLRLVENPKFSRKCTIDDKADPFLSMSHKDLNAAKPQEKIVLNDIFNPRPGADGKETTPRRILIEGRAGVGITTSCKKVVHDYIHQGMPAGFTTPITPQAFFLANKYNSRYAAMWQSVTGLLDVQSTAQHDSTALREFFDLLEAEPRDLLGFAHLRLLINCIVEVAVASYGIGGQGRIDRQILSWIDSGYGPLATGIVVTSEREYPQHILQKLVSRGPGNTQRLLMRETYSPAFELEY
ncbi:nucleoside phosphorylase domain-containing protein [Aspergillus tetrazonus]